MKRRNYVLLIDENEDILQVQKMSLMHFYQGDVHLLQKVTDAPSLITRLGHPEILLLDSQSLLSNNADFYHFIEKEKTKFPVIVCTTEIKTASFMDKYPAVTAFVEKPFSVESLITMVKAIMIVPERKLFAPYLPISIEMIVKYSSIGFDFYLKLAEDNFVKVVNKNELFDVEDGEKFSSKGILDLYIKSEEALSFLRSCEQKLLRSEARSQVENISLSLSLLEMTEGLMRRMGLSNEILEEAKKCIDSSIEILSKNEKILSVLKTKLQKRNSSYSNHIGISSLICCALSSKVDWIGDSANLKLVMAALVHDLSIDENYYEDIRHWNKRAADLSDKDSDVLNYRFHPNQSCKMVEKLEAFPPDVDQILLQHHEKLDGSGFPRGLKAGRINPLAALFIITEDFVEFIGDGANLETSITDFLTWGNAYYSTGYFKRIYSVLAEMLGN